MKIVAVIILFVFGNMNDQETQMTQYIPMANAGECLYEKRMLKKNKDFPKDAFCGPAYVEISDDGEVLKLDVKTVSFRKTGPKKGHRINRVLNEHQKKIGVKLLYVYPDGRCDFHGKD